MTAPSPRILAGGAEIGKALKTLVSEVLSRHPRKESLGIIGVREGGVVLCQRLFRDLEKADQALLGMGALDITLYRDDFAHRLHWPTVKGSEIPFPLDQMSILLVDDVIFTGRTIRAALDAILDYGRPRRIYLLVLVDRGERELPIAPDFVGFKVQLPREEGCFVEWKELGAKEDRIIALPWKASSA
jgi:pyrimidine operon attenuation protein/uracil phosphoribosyltransferase